MAASLVKIACVVVVCMALVGAPVVQGAKTCEQVLSELAPCGPYLINGGEPSAGCCNGVKSVVDDAKTTADKQDVCNCLKSAAGSITSSMAQNAESLPGKCGVSIPYKISTSTDCDRKPMNRPLDQSDSSIGPDLYLTRSNPVKIGLDRLVNWRLNRCIDPRTRIT